MSTVSDWTRRNILDAGYIPPEAATRPRRCYCGVTWDPGECGVRRWAIAGRVLWVSTCPSCNSTQTTYERGYDDE